MNGDVAAVSAPVLRCLGCLLLRSGPGPASVCAGRCSRRLFPPVSAWRSTPCRISKILRGSIPKGQVQRLRMRIGVRLRQALGEGLPKACREGPGFLDGWSLPDDRFSVTIAPISRGNVPPGDRAQRLQLDHGWARMTRMERGWIPQTVESVKSLVSGDQRLRSESKCLLVNQQFCG